jgi:hypothetical protein
MSNDTESGTISVRSLLAAKSLVPALRARIAAADADGDGSLSPDEVLDVLRSELALASERRVLRRVAAALAVGLVLAVAAIAGLTYGVVAASKDTASSGGALVDKASGAPLATGVATGRQDLSVLWEGADDASMAGLTAIYATGADGVRRMWRVAGVEVAAGAWARVNASEPGVSLYIDAEGISLEGVPAEQGGDATGAGRRLLGGTGISRGCFSWGNTCTCGSGVLCDCSNCANCDAPEDECRAADTCARNACTKGAPKAENTPCRDQGGALEGFYRCCGNSPAGACSASCPDSSRP